MNNKFKIGDRVVCINNTNNHLKIHKWYTVKFIFNNFISLSEDDRVLYHKSRFSLKKSIIESL